MPIGETRNVCVASNNSPRVATEMSHHASRTEPTARPMPVRRCRIESAEVIWNRYQVGNMKGDKGRSISNHSLCRRLATPLILPGPVQGKRPQQTHHVVVVLFGCSEAANDPVEQVGIGTIEQSLETVELCAVEIGEMNVGKSAKNEVALLR